MKLEAYTKISETAKISGVALIPRISRNNNLYTKAELERFVKIRAPTKPPEEDCGKRSPE